LADDIKQSVDDYNLIHSPSQPIHTAVWDGRQSLQAVQEGKLPWAERQEDFQSIQTHGGMIIATLEALARLTMGFAERQHIRLTMIDLLWRCHHLVIDEAHTLNTRAFGLLHLWITAIAVRYKRGHPAPKLTLLSATHSNLLKDLLEEEYLPSEYIEIFDEHVSEAPDCRLIHGEVTVHVHDEDLAAVVAAYAKTLLRERGKVLVVYDSLIQMRRDTSKLKQIFCQDCGVDPQHIIMINGQDRQVEQVSGPEDVFAMGTRPQPHHRVIIGTSAVEMGVNFQVDAAIIGPGQDAAALLQRIGRVARGRQPGIIHISKPQGEVPHHFIRLQQSQGLIPFKNLYEIFAPLRVFNTARAKELGRAYWSMLRRRDKHLMAGLEEAFIDIMGDDVPVPGRLLDNLWKAEGYKFRERRAFMKWLKAIDDTLQDVRGFAPTVKLKFPDRSFTYSRDWVAKYLCPPIKI
jgi:CRISPR-associated nuclease/helicase Cas3-like protein